MDMNNTLKQIVDSIFLEEIKEKNNRYLTYVARANAGSLIHYLFKMEYLLPNEANEENKGHWKDEVANVLYQLISQLGEVKSSDLILIALNGGVEDAHKIIKKELREKYSSLFKEKDYNENIAREIAQKYFPTVAKWLYNNYRDVLKNKVESHKLAHELVNSWFG